MSDSGNAVMDTFLTKPAGAEASKATKDARVPNTTSKPTTTTTCSESDASDSDDISGIEIEIKRPRISVYPRDSNGRRFQADWYKRYDWLEYSVKQNSAFCYACRCFTPDSAKPNSFTHTGMCNCVLYIYTGMYTSIHQLIRH